MEDIFSDKLLSTILLVVWMIMTLGLILLFGFFGSLILLSETWTNIADRALNAITR